jgi:MFS family permease
MISRAPQTIKRFFKHPLFLSLYLPSLLAFIAVGLRTPILPLYAGEITHAYGLIGLLVAAEGIGTLMADLPIAGLVRKLGPRWGMIIGLIVEAGTTVALMWVDSIALAIGLRLISGIGFALFGIARHTYITEAIRIEVRGQAMSLFGGVYRAGLLVGPVVGGVIATRYGLRLPFAAYGIFCVAAILVLVFAKNHFLKTEPSTNTYGVNQIGLREALKGRFWIFTCASFAQVLGQITRAGQGLILPLWGADMLNLMPDQIGWAVSLTSAIGIALFYPVGIIMDKVGRKATIVPSFILIGLGLALLPLTRDFSGLLWISVLIGLGHGFGSGGMLTLGADLAPQNGTSAFLSAWRWIGDTGVSGGPVIVGYIAEALALPAASLVIAGASLLAALVFSVLVPETLKKKSRG